MGQLKLSDAMLNKVSGIGEYPVPDVLGAYNRGYDAVQNQQIKGQNIEINKQKMEQNNQLYDLNNYKLNEAEQKFIEGEQQQKMDEAAQKEFAEIDYTDPSWMDKATLIRLKYANTLDEKAAALNKIREIQKDEIELEKARVGLQKVQFEYNKSKSESNKPKEFAPKEIEVLNDEMTQMEKDGETNTKAYKRLEARVRKLSTITGASEYDADYNVDKTAVTTTENNRASVYEKSLVGQIASDTSNLGISGKGKQIYSSVVGSFGGEEYTRKNILSQNRRILQNRILDALRVEGTKTKQAIENVVDMVPDDTELFAGSEGSVAKLFQLRKRLSEIASDREEGAKNRNLTKSDRSKLSKSADSLNRMLDEIAPPIPKTKSEFEAIDPRTINIMLESVGNEEFGVALKDFLEVKPSLRFSNKYDESDFTERLGKRIDQYNEYLGNK